MTAREQIVALLAERGPLTATQIRVITGLGSHAVSSTIWNLLSHWKMIRALDNGKLRDRAYEIIPGAVDANLHYVAPAAPPSKGSGQIAGHVYMRQYAGWGRRSW